MERSIGHTRRPQTLGRARKPSISGRRLPRHWVAGGAFTAAFKDAYERIATLDRSPAVPDDVSPDDKPRRQAVVEELDEACPSVVLSDLSAMTGEAKTFLSTMLEVGALIDRLYAHTLGITALADQVPADDVASLSPVEINILAGKSKPIRDPCVRQVSALSVGSRTILREQR